MTKRLNWSREETLKFLENFKAFPELWNGDCFYYRSRKRKDAACEKLGILFDRSAIEIRAKIHNMRTQFHQERKKPYTTWEYYQYMQFLEPHLEKTLEDEHLVNPVPLMPISEVTSSSYPHKKRKSSPEIKNGDSDQLREPKYAKFGEFIASTMENMQEKDLEKLCEIKIRMILAEISREAAHRQLLAFHEETVPVDPLTTIGFNYSNPNTEDPEFIAEPTPNRPPININQ